MLEFALPACACFPRTDLTRYICSCLAGAAVLASSPLTCTSAKVSTRSMEPRKGSASSFAQPGDEDGGGGGGFGKMHP